MEAFIKFVVALGLGAAITAGGLAYFKETPTPTTNEPVSYGSVSGPDQYVFTHFYDNVNIGGFDFATSSIGAATYTAASLLKTRLIEHNAASSLTVTLPTAATLSSAGFMPNPGDTQSFWIHASTTLITVAGNTGITLYSASSTKQIAAGSIGKVECVRLGATEARLIECLLTAD